MSLANLKCCTSETQKLLNPHLVMGQNGDANNGFIDLNSVTPGIREQMKDLKKVNSFFEKNPYIPYSGNSLVTSHSLVEQMFLMRNMSTTKQGTVNSINSYCFGGKISLVAGADPDFELANEQVILEGDQMTSYYNFLKSIDLYGSSWKKLIKTFSTSRQVSGEMPIECIMTEIEGQRFFGINYIGPQFLCQKKNTGSEKIMGFSECWTDEYTKKYPVTDYAVYPHVSQHADGSWRTIIFQTDSMFGFRGRPIDYSSFYSQYNEYKLDELVTKEISTAFLGKILIEVEKQQNSFVDNASATGSGYKSALDRIEKHYTIKGKNPSSVIAFDRSQGATPAKVVQLKSDNGAESIIKLQDFLKRNIYVANDWAESLVEKSKASGFNSNMYKDLFSILSCTRVVEHQEFVMMPLNAALRLGGEWLNVDIAMEAMIEMPSSMKKLLADNASDKIFTDYSAAVRSGAITPQIEDEIHARGTLNFPPMGDAVKEQWETDKIRKPITLKNKDQDDAETVNVIND